jgi:hypothetical protein
MIIECLLNDLHLHTSLLFPALPNPPKLSLSFGCSDTPSFMTPPLKGECTISVVFDRVIEDG